MKATFYIFGITFLLGSCGQRLGEYYFEFDAVEWHTIEVDEGPLFELLDQPGLSESQQLQIDIIINNKPESIADTASITGLEKIGFTKSVIKDPKKVNAIKEIHREKSHKESVSTSCVAVYRDILILRNQGKIVGVSKICFECHKHQIRGTNAKTWGFGQSGDYGKLARILNEHG